jgi:ABC-2 type transport system ATP-binding protein
MSLSVRNLTKIYGEQKAVDNISFEAKPGEILGFLGPNGAGKSTTMKIATGYLSATSGTIEVCGIDTEKNALESKKIIGYLPEHNALYLDMYVHEYLRFAGKICGVKNAEERAKEMIERVGLTREQNKKIAALSKGYRQRVGLAKAMIHEPKVLILDEPTTGLDPNQIVEIRQVIKDLGKDKTIIFSTHIMQEVQALCDRVVIINLGQIVADSSTEMLKSAAAQYDIVLGFEKSPVSTDSFLEVEQVLSVKVISENQLKITASSDVRGELFRFCAERSYILNELRLEERSLELIFRELTQKKS